MNTMHKDRAPEPGIFFALVAVTIALLAAGPAVSVLSQKVFTLSDTSSSMRNLLVYATCLAIAYGLLVGSAGFTGWMLGMMIAKRLSVESRRIFRSLIRAWISGVGVCAILWAISGLLFSGVYPAIIYTVFGIMFAIGSLRALMSKHANLGKL
jgi:hypothetical protein